MKNVPDSGQPLVTLKSYISSKSSQTLLEFLCGRFKYHTPDEWREIIEEGRVQVNDRQASPGQPLRAGDEVAYTTSSWKEPEVRKDFRVLHEDDALAILSKPAPLPVHAIGAYFKNTLMYLLRESRPEARDWHLVHRLDSETSGLLVLAKDAMNLVKLQKHWRGAGSHPHPSPLPSRERGEDDGGREMPSPLRGEGGANAPGEGAASFPSPLVGEGRVRGAVGVLKSYRAIVFGKFPEGTTVVDAPIGPKRGSEIRMKLAVSSQDVPSPLEGEGRFRRRSEASPGNGVRGKGKAGAPGEDTVESPKPSLTEFTLLQRKRASRSLGVGREEFSLIEARPLTGRTHQIRVHLEHLGFPIVGDKLYAGADETFLHFYEHDWDEWMEKRVLLPRMALHAFRLEFGHPATGERVRFEDPMPPDLSDFWSRL